MNNGAMAKLKAATTDAHRSIEGSFDVMRPDLDVERYRHWVEKFHGFYSQLESRIEPLAREIPGLDYESRKKASVLRRDLLDCGRSEAELEMLPRAACVPSASSLASLVGILYVVEGSTLGGRVIDKHLQSVLPESHRMATRFFTGYGADTGPKWMAFAKFANETLDSDESVVEAVQAANETFRALGEWLRD